MLSAYFFALCCLTLVECWYLSHVGLDFLKSPYPEIHGVDLWQVYDQDLYKLHTRNITVNK